MQDLIFLLEFKIHQQRGEILDMPFWEARMRLRQLGEYYEEQKRSIESSVGKAGGK